MSVRTPDRRLITILDALIIVTASAALVVALGGRSRFRVGGTLVRIQSPLNMVIVAAMLAAVRLAVARFTRLLPAIDVPVSWRERVERERLRMAQREPPSRRVSWYAAVAVAGSLVWVVPHIVHIRYVPDPGDPVFSAWRLAALVHQATTDPRHLWDGNIFYPLPLTLTYSDSLFLQSILGAPFILAGADPLVVMNVLMVLSFPARGLAFFFLTWRITGNAQAALVAALAGAWSPFYASHYSQLELQSTAFVPLSLLLVMRAFAAPSWRRGVLAGAAVSAQCLACMYVGTMLVSFLVPFAALLAIAWARRPWRTLVSAIAGAALIVLPVVGALGASYLKTRQVHGDRSISEVSDGSASPRDYADAHARLITYRWRFNTHHHVERELFPGTMPLALGAIGLLPPLTPAVMATVTGGAAAFDWSLGLKGLTYDDLYRRLPPYRGMRVASRFSAMVEAALAILTAFGAARIFGLKVEATRAGVATRGVICAVLCAAVLVDLRMDIGLHPYLPGIPAIYERVNPSMVLAEEPGGHPVDYMYFSTRHWAKLLDGYSGFFPDLRELNAAREGFPARDSVAAFRRLGATHLTFNCAFLKMNGGNDGDCEHVFAELAINPTLEEVATERWMGGEIRLYRYR
jgi:hypothetical protein